MNSESEKQEAVIASKVTIKKAVVTADTAWNNLGGKVEGTTTKTDKDNIYVQGGAAAAAAGDDFAAEPIKVRFPHVKRDA